MGCAVTEPTLDETVREEGQEGPVIRETGAENRVDIKTLLAGIAEASVPSSQS